MPEYQYERIYNRVVQAVSEVSGVPRSDLNGGTSLATDLCLDSLAMFEVVIDLEEAFKLQISDEEIDRIKTIQDVVLFIERKEYPIGHQSLV
jgi:acyl carrier protein